SMPSCLGRLETQVVRAGADKVAFQDSAVVIEANDLECATQDDGELRSRCMSMRTEIGFPLRDDEEALYQIAGRVMNILVRAGARTDGCLGGEIVEQSFGKHSHENNLIKISSR